MVHLKRTALLPIVLLALLATGCILQFQASDDYERSFGQSGASVIELDSLDGDLDFRGVVSSTITFRGTRRAVGSTAERARDNLEYADLKRSRRGDSLLFEFNPPLDKLGLVDLTLDEVSSVPREMGVHAFGSKGDISMDGMVGDLDLITGRGNIVVLGGVGNLDIRTRAGALDVATIGEIQARSTLRAYVAALGENENRAQVATRGSSIFFRIESQGFEITCEPGGGEVHAEDELDVEREDLEDGQVILTSGDGARKVLLDSDGGDIYVERITTGSP